MVQEGFSGIPALLVTDPWSSSEVGVRVPFYRPASFMLFAAEWELFPDNPAIYHLVNVICYAITSWLLFVLLSRICGGKNLLFPFTSTLLFIAHPIHTEVVNNIKSADEILCFLFAIISSISALNFVRNNSPLQLLFVGLAFFISLLSKETGIAFLLIIPLMLYFFTTAKTKQTILVFGTLAIALIPYFMMRSYALQLVSGYEHSLLVNPLYETTDFISQRATALYALLRYEWLLIFPHPLSYNYDYAQITLKNLANPLVILSMVIQIALLIYALFKTREKNLLSFSILFFFLAIAPVANIFMIIGTIFGERLLYIPSMGYCMALLYGIFKLFKLEISTPFSVKLKDLGSRGQGAYLCIGLLVLLYTFKTSTRSRDWKDNVSLFGQDVKIATHSAPAHYHWGNALMSVLYEKEQDPEKKTNYLNQAIIEYQTAISIYPQYADAILHVGDAFNKLGDVNKAITYIEEYNAMMQYSRPDMLQYLAQLYNQSGQLDKGIVFYKAIVRQGSASNAELYYAIGQFYNKKQDYAQAIVYLDSCLQLQPNNLQALNNMIIANLNLPDYEAAITTGEQILQLDPQNQKVYTFLGVAYNNLGNYPKAIEVLQKAIQLDPNDQESQQRLKILEDFQKNKQQ